MKKLISDLIALILWALVLFCLLRGLSGCSPKQKAPVIQIDSVAFDTLRAQALNGVRCCKQIEPLLNDLQKLNDSLEKLNNKLHEPIDYSDVSTTDLTAVLQAKYKEQAKHVKLPKIKIK